MNDSQHLGLTVSMLRAVTDFDPYTPDSQAPGWLQVLGRIAKHDGGALAIAGPSGLRVGGAEIPRSRAMPDAPSMFMVGLVDRMRGTGRHLALGIPPAARHLPLLLAASAVLADVVDRSSGAPRRGDGSVLIVSPDLEVRSRYCDLCVRSEFIDETYPGSRMRPDGERVMLRRNDHVHLESGVCFFLPGLALPNYMKLRPTLMLLDMRYSRWVKRAADLVQWAVKLGQHAGVVALYTVGDSDTLRTLTSQGFEDFPVDHSAVTACIQHVPQLHRTSRAADIDWSLGVAPGYLAREHEIVLISRGEDIEGLLRDIDRLLYQHAQKDTRDLRRARWLLAVLNHLPVPLVTYEYSARALGRSHLKRVIDQLGIASQDATDIMPAIKRIKDLFSRLYDTLGKANPREIMLRDLLPQVMSKSEGEQVLFLVRDRVIERAFRDWVTLEVFPDANWIPRLDIQAYPTYFASATQRYAQVLVNGAFSRRYKWIVGAALGAHVTFLSYAHEVEVIQRQLDVAYSNSELMARTQLRFQTAARLAGGRIEAGGPEAAIPPLLLRVPRVDTPPADEGIVRTETKSNKTKFHPRATLTDLSQLADAFQKSSQDVAADAGENSLANWAEDTEEEDPPEGDFVKEDARLAYGTMIDCRRVVVNSRTYGQGIVWIDQNRPIELFKNSNTDALQIATPDKIAAGDVLLLTHDEERMNLFDRIVQLAEGQPRMQYLTARRRAWQEAVRRMAARYRNGNDMNYGAILHALRREGASIISAQAVRYWVEGYVIGPESIKSIIAVGRVSQTEALVRSAREFDMAFREIRGIRQAIGMRLSNAIRRSFRSLAQGESGQGGRLDDHLGIALDELLDTIDLAEVISVGASLQCIAPHWVGRFVRE